MIDCTTQTNLLPGAKKYLFCIFESGDEGERSFCLPAGIAAEVVAENNLRL